MSNDISKVSSPLLAQGLMALRSMNVMPRLINSDYQGDAQEKNSVINVPIPSAVTTLDVAPGPIAPTPGDSAPTSVGIVLDQWKEAAFYLTDFDVMQSISGVIPMQASEAIKSLANTINAYILNMGKGFYGYAGTAGTTPFAADATAAAAARKVLNKQLCPTGDRRIVLDMDAEGNAISLPLFQQVQQAGTNLTQVEGVIGRKIGFDWYADQQVPTFVAGTITGTLAAKAATGQGAGTKNVILTTGAASSIALKKGDILTFAGDAQTYVVTADTAQPTASTDIAVPIYPGLVIAKAGGEAVSIKPSHVMNLAFHRDAIAFATRPLLQVSHPAVIANSAIDPVSGLALRLEITREYKRTRFAYDVLFGGQVIRPELGMRLAG